MQADVSVLFCILQTKLSFQFLCLATISHVRNAFAIAMSYELCCSGVLVSAGPDQQLDLSRDSAAAVQCEHINAAAVLFAGH